MKNILLKIIPILLFFYSSALAADDPVVTKGLYLPSIGRMNVLFIFVQFSDDNLDVSNSEWPKGKLPVDMNKTVDETWSENPTTGSLTHYYNEMSFNKFKFTGKCVSIIAPHSRAGI